MDGGFYNVDMRALPLTVVVASIAVPALCQTPQPFPRPGGQQPPTSTTVPAVKPVTPTAPAQSSSGAIDPQAPTAATLGVPIYPTAQFLASYDAGRGQRYYLFGIAAGYAETVTYYRTQLDERGTLVFKEPPTHMFEVGRFRDETMAFPPGVTVKDWTWGGSKGYPNPKPGAEPARFPTILMIVPAPAAPPTP